MREAVEAAARALEDAAAALKRDGDPRDAMVINWLKARAGAELSKLNE